MLSDRELVLFLEIVDCHVLPLMIVRRAVDAARVFGSVQPYGCGAEHGGEVGERDRVASPGAAV